MVISATIASVHAKLSATPGYASFCNVNETVNCDVVLSSEYAYFAGVPVAWWSILAYAAFAAGAYVAMSAKRATQRRQAATAVFVLAAFGLAYSAYLAYVAVFELRAVCLLCSGLYLVNTGLGPFYDGASHFVLTPEDLLPAVALALLAGQGGARTGRRALFALPGAWLVGGLGGLALPTFRSAVRPAMSPACA